MCADVAWIPNKAGTRVAMSSSNPVHLEYTEPPGFFPIYRRLIFGRRAKYHAEEGLPNFRATWSGARAEQDRVERYCAACSLDYDGHYPLLYPHILTSAIHLDMMSKPLFPLSPMGAVHSRNHIIQHAPIPVDAALEITCELTTTRILKQGVEFEVTTTLELDGARVWESVSAYLVRGKKFGEPVEGSPLAELPPLDKDLEEHTWPVPKDMGWRYAKITGDFNPIHISKILAKFMGFNRDLIHGMWSAARCVGHSPTPGSDGPVQADLIFKGPVYMESSSTMKSQVAEDSTLFELYCDDNPRPCIRGRVQPVAPGSQLVSGGA